jgi:hypothetical protein
MRATPHKQCLHFAVMLSVTLVIVGMLRLGAAIRRGEIVPPTLGLQLGIVRIVMHATHYPECPPYTHCELESAAPPKTFYVVWSIYEPPTVEQPYGRTARRVLVVPLNPR